MGKGMTAKKKGHSDRTKKYLISDKQIKRIKLEITEDVTSKANLISVAATADCFGLNEEQICKLAETTDRYSNYVDKHLIKINQIADIVEKNTNVRYSRF